VNGRAIPARAIALLGAITLVIALAGCANARPVSAPDPQLAGTWHLVVATERGKTVASGAEEITFTIGDTTHTGGSSPCSFYTASVTGGLGAIFIDAGLINRGADCSDEALLHIDDQYIAALDATTVASIDDGVLVLSSPHSSLVFIKPTASSLGTLQNTNWSLLEPPNLRDSTAVRLTFGSANQLTISTRCSLSIARYVLIEDIIILRAVQTTPVGKKACSAVDLTARDALSGQLTADVSSATVSGPATLVLTNRGNEEPMLWRAG
jgi:heat shock protein HslJ